MKTLIAPVLAALAGFGAAVVPHSPAGQDPQDPQKQMAEMMAKAKRYTQPGPHHELLHKFLGTWRTETTLFGGGRPMGAKTVGRAEATWLIDGRYLHLVSQGQLMGQDVEWHQFMGYDNFKQSYVATSVSSFDTAMTRAEGDLDPGGEVLLLYGTLDEYLTGEHDKMVKTLWRFVSDDEMVMEIHDLPIGLENTKVIEVRMTRES